MSKLITLEIAVKAAAASIMASETIPKTYSPLKNQILRSSASIPLNIAEGTGRFGKDRRHHYRIAYGSLRETVTALNLLRELKVNNEEITKALNLLDRTGALLWKLINST